MNHKLDVKSKSRISLIHLLLVAILFMLLGSFLGGKTVFQKVALLRNPERATEETTGET